MNKIENLEGEIWKPVHGYEGRYDVSNMGRVKSLGRKGSGCRKYDFVLSPGMGTSGYLMVNLSMDGVSKSTMIHRLVANHFVENTELKPEVDHVNTIKTDNRASNLEWVTSSENTIRGLNKGIMNTAKGSMKKRSKFTEEQVHEIKKRLINGEQGAVIAKEFGVNKVSIYAIKSGKTWKHVSV